MKNAVAACFDELHPVLFVLYENPYAMRCCAQVLINGPPSCISALCSLLAYIHLSARSNTHFNAHAAAPVYTMHLQVHLRDRSIAPPPF